MPLSHHYRAAQSLSPGAARLASRLLDLSAGVPFAWRVSLRMALVERGRSAPPADAAAGGVGADSPSLDQARCFIRALRADPAARHDA